MAVAIWERRIILNVPSPEPLIARLHDDEPLRFDIDAPPKNI